MKFFRRRYNPIFIEEECQDWGKRNRFGSKLLFVFVIFAIVIGTLYFFLQ